MRESPTPRLPQPGRLWIGMLTDELLTQVQRPARYIGAEHNMVRKDPASVDVRVALCYPDVYEVGMSHVGLQILYHVVNQRDDAYCERAFHPDADCARLLRETGVPLCALESGDPLSAFDIVGITLRSEDRTDADPLVIAGGPGALNPEPLAEFIDAFVVGDGEEAIGEVIAICGSALQGATSLRAARLEALAALPGVYVPSLHDPATAHVRRRLVADLDAAPYPRE